jgi:hypothetical protein
VERKEWREKSGEEEWREDKLNDRCSVWLMASIAGYRITLVLDNRAQLRQYCITIGSVITFVSALCALRRLSYFLGPELSSCSLG